MAKISGHLRTPEEAKRHCSAWPTAWRDGARCAFLERYDGAREPGGYPKGFHSWSLERRNAWFGGFNRGRCDRLSIEEGASDAA